MLKRKASPSPLPQQPGPETRTPSIATATCSSIELPKGCTFLGKLPLELRLHVYEYLVVSSSALKGKTAREEHEETGIDLTILRVNRQIHDEALPLFYGRNTFYITSIPDSSQDCTAESSPSSATYDPPLPSSHWSLIRHLTIGLLYIPETLVQEPGANGVGWKPVDARAESYISLLTTLLRTCTPKLLTLNLSAEVPATFDAKKCLVGFFICDQNHEFASALARLETQKRVNSIPLAFEFSDCYFRLKIEPGTFMKKSILLLACQVMFCQSKVRVDAMMKAFEAQDEKEGEGQGKTDLTPYVGDAWGEK